MDKTFVLKNIYFDFDKSILLPASFAELERLFIFLKAKNVSIIINGHTDNIGTDEYNKELSLSRAKAVSDWLIEKGIDRNRIQIEGYGAKMPIVDNNTNENRAINRRVEFIITKR
jgi:outer membrane protein OmpA-like peptidoglycan-associated protein